MMFNLFITIDVEVWPRSPGWPHRPLPPLMNCERELDAYLFGRTNETRFGLPYQLRTFSKLGLKATCFVDPLFSFVLGGAALRETLALISSHGQEIGLHLHPEWLADPRCVGLPEFRGPLLRQYPEDDQAALICAGASRLESFGAPTVRSFRAGSWGADHATLRALRRANLLIDSSLNPVFPASFPDFDGRVTQCQPAKLEGVWEFPVTCFVDRHPSGYRPLSVGACSFDEFRSVLEQAEEAGRSCAVIVLHSFEFVRVNRLARGHAGPQRLLAARFERLCSYLAKNAHRYRTTHFTDLDVGSMPLANAILPIVSSPLRTLRRHVEQAAARIY